MTKMVGLIVAVGALLLLGGSSAGADPGQVNGHNCAGAVVSGFAGPGFGQLVAAAAHAQLVDNLGIRNCGQANGNNP